ncbi:MAG: hypothetical protein DMG39_12250 [Acidobacteria bacterium]|nr:MAG: hypothetical protein DMG39_12250 [Acidobacteriota bacterium]
MLEPCFIADLQSRVCPQEKRQQAAALQIASLATAMRFLQTAGGTRPCNGYSQTFHFLQKSLENRSHKIARRKFKELATKRRFPASLWTKQIKGCGVLPPCLRQPAKSAAAL